MPLTQNLLEGLLAWAELPTFSEYSLVLVKPALPVPREVLGTLGFVALGSNPSCFFLPD